MNNTRRKALKDLVADLNSFLELLEVLKDEEQEYLYNIPENLQGSERYDRAESCLTYLDDACAGLDEVISNIENAIE